MQNGGGGKQGGVNNHIPSISGGSAISVKFHLYMQDQDLAHDPPGGGERMARKWGKCKTKFLGIYKVRSWRFRMNGGGEADIPTDKEMHILDTGKCNMLLMLRMK